MFTLGYTITSIFKALGLSGIAEEQTPSNLLLATKLPRWILEPGDPKDREMFEDLFTVYDNDVQIHYVASLARARITFSDVVCDSFYVEMIKIDSPCLSFKCCKIPVSYSAYRYLIFLL